MATGPRARWPVGVPSDRTTHRSRRSGDGDRAAHSDPRVTVDIPAGSWSLARRRLTPLTSGASYQVCARRSPLPDRAAVTQRAARSRYDHRMSRVFVTGMSGAGKSTLLAGLASRGHTVLDTDYDGWVLTNGRWDEGRMRDLLTRATKIVVSGTVQNQVKFYDRSIT